jgi:hypothetical protein
MATCNTESVGERLSRITAESKHQHDLKIKQQAQHDELKAQQRELKEQRRAQQHDLELQNRANKSIPTLLKIFERKASLCKVEALIYPSNVVWKSCHSRIKTRDDYEKIVDIWSTHEGLGDVEITYNKYNKNLMRNFIIFNWEKKKLLPTPLGCDYDCCGHILRVGVHKKV